MLALISLDPIENTVHPQLSEHDIFIALLVCVKWENFT